MYYYKNSVNNTNMKKIKKFALFNIICYNSDQLYEKRELRHKDQGVLFMKKKFYVGALVSLMSIPMTVNAAGVSTVKFEGQTNVNVGDEFTVNMVLDNIEGTNNGVVAFGGYINYDNSVLELVSTTQGDAYEVMINNRINKIAAMDFSLENGIKERTNVYTLTFKAIGEGNSSITLTKPELVDANAELVSANINGLYVNAKNIEVKNEQNTVENYVEVAENTEIEEKNDTTESVVETTVKNKEINEVKKEEKIAKKVVSNKKDTKNLFEIIIKFFEKIFKK